MQNITGKLISAVFLVTAGADVMALDTSQPLLCAVSQVQQCVDGAGCDLVLPEEVDTLMYGKSGAAAITDCGASASSS